MANNAAAENLVRLGLRLAKGGLREEEVVAKSAANAAKVESLDAEGVSVLAREILADDRAVQIERIRTAKLATGDYRRI